MRISRISLGFVLMMVIANATFAQKVTTDYNKGADLTKYKTFMWIKDVKTSDPLTQQQEREGTTRRVRTCMRDRLHASLITRDSWHLSAGHLRAFRGNERSFRPPVRGRVTA